MSNLLLLTQVPLRKGGSLQLKDRDFSMSEQLKLYCLCMHQPTKTSRRKQENESKIDFELTN